MRKTGFRLQAVLLALLLLCSALPAAAVEPSSALEEPVSAPDAEALFFQGGAEESTFLGDAAENPFLDLSDESPYYNAVLYCYSAGIVKGVEETLFAPEETLTRAMFVTLLGRVAETMGLRTEGYESPFLDVEADGWYDAYVGWAAAKGFVNGTGEETFEPDAPVTREQTAAILTRFAEKTGLSLSTAFAREFADFEEVSDWARTSVATAVAAGLTPLSELLLPQQAATRAETAFLLYRLSSDYIKDIQLLEGFGKYLRVFENLPKNPYIKESFVTLENNYKGYESDDLTAILGIDVSVHQGEIDWAAVRAAGVQFAILRVGYRGYSVGEIYEDARFVENIENALANGIAVGVYFFSQAITVEEALEEADFVLSRIQGYDLRYPVVFDWENISGDRARTDNLSAQTLTDCAIAFCDRIAAAGYTPMIYFNQYISLLLYDLGRLEGIDFWLAEYNETPNFHYGFQMWQYGSRGSVDGIAGNVDMNLSFVDYGKEETGPVQFT